jgi:hypothetical protein
MGAGGCQTGTPERTQGGDDQGDDRNDPPKDKAALEAPPVQ